MALVVWPVRSWTHASVRPFARLTADWDTPMGGACPQNYTVCIQSEGKSSCVPISFSNYPNMAPCPAGYQLDPATEGKYCIPL
jgi:hypothetical protein